MPAGVCCEGDLTKRIIRGSGGLIDLLATGQQFIACGTHPSGVRYKWDTPLPFDAPTLTLAQLDELWAGLAFEYGDESSVTLKACAPPTVPRKPADINDPVADWLDSNGWVTGYNSDGRVDMRCPWETGHRTDSGPSSTSYYPAGVGGFHQGHFKCLHASCASRTDSQFLVACGLAASEFEASEMADTEGATATAQVRSAQRLALAWISTQHISPNRMAQFSMGAGYADMRNE